MVDCFISLKELYKLQYYIRFNLLLVALRRSLNKQSFYVYDMLRVRMIHSTVYVAIIVCIPIILYTLQIISIQD
jgi:hypothetical protein